MDDTVQIVIAVLLSVIIFFIFPIYIAYEKKDDLAYALSTKYVSEFVEEVKTKGYISADMYLELKNKLVKTGNTFDIYMEHKANKCYPSGNSDGYINVTEIYTEEQILDTLGIKDNNMGIGSKVGQISFTNLLKNENKDYLRINIADIPVRVNLFGVNKNYDTLETAIYVMNIGDEFNIRVKNNNKTIAASIFGSFTSAAGNPNMSTRIYVNYGGIITSEKYWN